MGPQLTAALIAFIGVIAAATLNLYWNFTSAKSARKLPFLNKQLEYCFEASEQAARLAATSDRDEWRAARARFFELYWGPLAIVEDDAVASAMVRFASTLRSVDDHTLPAGELTGLSLELSYEIRKLLLKAWKVSDLNSVLQAREA